METKTTSAQEENVKSEAIEAGKTMAIIAYLTIIGLVIAYIMNNEKKNAFAKYHIQQSLGLTLVAIVLMLINVIPILGWIVSFLGSFLILYLWIMGLVNAMGAKEKPLPLLGKKFEEWFKKIG